MAAKKKSIDKDLSRIGEVSSRSLRKAASMGEVVGNTSAGKKKNSEYFASTTVYSKGGTGKGTTGKRGGVVTSTKMPYIGPDGNKTTYKGRKINNLKPVTASPVKDEKLRRQRSGGSKGPQYK